ncbi:hypothetical protein ACWEWX_19305 [Streptomyces asiaticus]
MGQRIRPAAGHQHHSLRRLEQALGVLTDTAYVQHDRSSVPLIAQQYPLHGPGYYTNRFCAGPAACWRGHRADAERQFRCRREE